MNRKPGQLASERAKIIDMRKNGTSMGTLSQPYGVSRASIMRVLANY